MKYTQGPCDRPDVLHICAGLEISARTPVLNFGESDPSGALSAAGVSELVQATARDQPPLVVLDVLTPSTGTERSGSCCCATSSATSSSGSARRARSSAPGSHPSRMRAVQLGDLVRSLVYQENAADAWPRLIRPGGPAPTSVETGHPRDRHGLVQPPSAGRGDESGDMVTDRAERKQAELRAKLAGLDDEFATWLASSERDMPLEKHHTQIRAVIGSLQVPVEHLRGRIDDPRPWTSGRGPSASCCASTRSGTSSGRSWPCATSRSSAPTSTSRTSSPGRATSRPSAAAGSRASCRRTARGSPR